MSPILYKSLVHIQYRLFTLVYILMTKYNQQQSSSLFDPVQKRAAIFQSYKLNPGLQYNNNNNNNGFIFYDQNIAQKRCLCRNILCMHYGLKQTISQCKEILIFLLIFPLRFHLFQKCSSVNPFCLTLVYRFKKKSVHKVPLCSLAH